jgi:hypothetical protein
MTPRGWAVAVMLGGLVGLIIVALQPCGVVKPGAGAVVRVDTVYVERPRPVAHLYAWGEGGTGLWMHGKLPPARTWKRGDTLLLLTDESRFDE